MDLSGKEDCVSLRGVWPRKGRVAALGECDFMEREMRSNLAEGRVPSSWAPLGQPRIRLRGWGRASPVIRR